MGRGKFNWKQATRIAHKRCSVNGCKLNKPKAETPTKYTADFQNVYDS